MLPLSFPPNLTIASRGYDHTILIIHTHSDDSSGDLWYCSHDADLKGPVSIKINSVSEFQTDLHRF